MTERISKRGIGVSVSAIVVLLTVTGVSYIFHGGAKDEQSIGDAASRAFPVAESELKALPAASVPGSDIPRVGEGSLGAQAVDTDAIDNAAIRAALVSKDLRAIESAFDALARCTDLRTRRALLAKNQRRPHMEEHNRREETDIRNNERFCAAADHDLVTKHSSLLREVLKTQFSPVLANRYYDFGPLGSWDELTLRPNDPMIIQWFEEAKGYLIRAADTGDLAAMSSIEAINQIAPIQVRNQAEALTYLLVRAAITHDSQRRSQLSPATAQYIEQVSSSLSASEVASARSRAGNILKNCCNITTNLIDRAYK